MVNGTTVLEVVFFGANAVVDDFLDFLILLTYSFL